MHAHDDFANLRRLTSQLGGEPGRELPQLDRDRAAIGVDDQFALTERSDARAGDELDRQRCFELGLQLREALQPVLDAAESLVVTEMVDQMTRGHGIFAR